MPELVPFPALRYTAAAGDLSLLLAPPYDVIDEDQANELRGRSDHNCIRLILPQGSPEGRYLAASQTLDRWMGDGILAVDEQASAYVYRQRYRVDGVDRERLAVFGAVRLTPLDAGQVLPHEHTHSGPKRDRLALTLATRTQLSPIFMVAHDAGGDLYRLGGEAVADAPVAQASTPDGTDHTLAAVSGDRATTLLSAAGSGSLLIADGHHRYETALAVAEELGDNVKAAYVLVCVVSQKDPGLVVRPTHRVFTVPPADAGEAFDWAEALNGSFRLEDLGSIPPEEAERRASSAAPGSFVVLPGSKGPAFLATAHRHALAEAGIAPDRARIAPVLVDRLVLGEMYGLQADEAADRGILSYSRSPKIAASPPIRGCGFVLPPVSLEDVWATASRGGRLPPKSTYFEPKMPSGLLFRPL